MTMQGHETPPPTDLMHRRTMLAFEAAYLWLECIVLIRTNSVRVLSAAAEAGLLWLEGKPGDFNLHLSLISEEISESGARLFVYRTYRDEGNLYLDLGRGQWFAFDSQYGDGAGFVSATADESELCQTVGAIFEEIKKLLPGFRELSRANG